MGKILSLITPRFIKTIWVILFIYFTLQMARIIGAGGFILPIHDRLSFEMNYKFLSLFAVESFLYAVKLWALFYFSPRKIIKFLTQISAEE